MKKVLLLVFFILLIVFLTSCASTKFIVEPETPSMGTLLIGQIEVNVSGWPRPTAMNGVHKRDIEVHLYDYTRHKEITMTSKEEGTFYYVTDNNTKEINITGFEVNRVRGGGGDKSIVNLDYGKQIPLHKGKVNNVGHIIYTIEVTGQSPGMANRTKIEANVWYKVSGDIRQWFKKTFPESEWNNKEWVYIPSS